VGEIRKKLNEQTFKLLCAEKEMRNIN